jgi:hypothetical protein
MRMPFIPSGPSSLTADWFSEVLDADVQACKVEQIAIGVGLLGRLFRVHLDGGPGVPETVVVKLPTLDVTARTAICEELDFYPREVAFYQQIGLANPLPPARPHYAAVDEATHDFVLVLEDLGRLRNADQNIGCSLADAETLIDAVAYHQAYWWDNKRLASVPFLKSYGTPPFSTVVVGAYEAAWPVFVERIGYDMPPALRAYGERLPSLMPWYLAEVSRPPNTFLHGDLRLDQLFFAVNPTDAPVRVLDWQLCAKGRGAFDLAYFLSQSLPVETRRSHEHDLLGRYAERLAERGVDYSPEQILHDYRLTTAWCFVYPVIATGRIGLANERQLALLRTMYEGAATAIEDLNALTLQPD